MALFNSVLVEEFPFVYLLSHVSSTHSVVLSEEEGEDTSRHVFTDVSINLHIKKVLTCVYLLYSCTCN